MQGEQKNKKSKLDKIKKLYEIDVQNFNPYFSVFTEIK